MKYLRGQPDEDLEGEPYENHHFWMAEWREAYVAMQNNFKHLFPEYKDTL